MAYEQTKKKKINVHCLISSLFLPIINGKLNCNWPKTIEYLCEQVEFYWFLFSKLNHKLVNTTITIIITYYYSNKFTI